MTINNTKKNMLYKLGEKKETLVYLHQQLKEVGENEVAYGVSMSHIY